MRFLIKRANSLNLEEVEMEVKGLGAVKSCFYLPLTADQSIRMIVKANRMKPNFVIQDNKNIVGYVDGDAIFVGSNHACEIISLTDEHVDAIKKAFRYNILWLD